MSPSKGFGRLLRARRVAAGLSLRDVADKVGVSHVYLGEVERGVRKTMNAERWPALTEAIPGLTKEDLERAAMVSRPVQLHLVDAPPQYQDLAFALARRIEDKDLGKAEIRKLLSILCGGSDE